MTRTRQIAKVVVTSLLLIAALLWFWPTDKDPQGGAGPWCDNVNFQPIAGASGWTVSWHNTTCSGFGGSSAVYIYVHRAEQKESRETLVFRFFEAGGASLPKIEWLGETKLSIQVEHVSQITKQVSSIGPVTIAYKVGKQDYRQDSVTSR